MREGFVLLMGAPEGRGGCAGGGFPADDGCWLVGDGEGSLQVVAAVLSAMRIFTAVSVSVIKLLIAADGGVCCCCRGEIGEGEEELW
jgi:hypothetical protein